MQKITPFLWFDDNGEEAMNFYTSVFKDAKIVDKQIYSDGSQGEAGKFMTGTFELFGQKFMVLNGGPQFQFNESVSMFVTCEDQAEVDYYWDALTAEGTPSQCGWLKDKFGLSWQIVPKALFDCVGGPDPEGSQRAFKAMMEMSKLDVDTLQKAYAGI